MELAGRWENLPGPGTHAAPAGVLKPPQEPSAREGDRGRSHIWWQILSLPVDRVGPNPDFLREDFHPHRISGSQHLIYPILGIRPIGMGPDIPEGLIFLQAQGVQRLLGSRAIRDGMGECPMIQRFTVV